MTVMTIGKLAAAGGVKVETVRFYQRRGLLAEPDRATGARRYGTDDARRLRFIRSAQTAGFTLEEIRELLALDAGTDHARARDLASRRIKALTTKIAEMTAAKRSLERLAKECSTANHQPCPIILAFEGSNA